MDTSASKTCFLLFLLSIPLVCSSSGSFHSTAKHFVHNRQLIQTTQHDLTQTPITTLPTTPVTNPVTTPTTVPIPPALSSPPLVTIPSANPTTPITYPPVAVTPVTNPVTTPSTTNPATTYPAPTAGDPTTATPAVALPGTAATNAPAVPGQSWCVAKSGAPQSTIQAALDYACGLGGADCSTIQQGANCYNPNSLQNHASYAFNSYYQKNPVQTSCDFGGAAMVTNVNPSSGSCIFPTGSSSSSASPVTPTTESSSGATPAGLVTPPTLLNASSPSLGGSIAGYGENPPTANISSGSAPGPSNLRPVLGCIIVVTTIITGHHQWI